MTDKTDAEILETVLEHLTPETLVHGWGVDGEDAGCILHHVAKADEMELQLGVISREYQVGEKRPKAVTALYYSMYPDGVHTDLDRVTSTVYNFNDGNDYETMVGIVKGAIGILDEKDQS